MEEQSKLNLEEDASKHYYLKSFYGRASSLGKVLEIFSKYKTLVDSLDELENEFDVKTFVEGSDVYVKIREK